MKRFIFSTPCSSLFKTLRAQNQTQASSSAAVASIHKVSLCPTTIKRSPVYLRKAPNPSRDWSLLDFLKSLVVVGKKKLEVSPPRFPVKVLKFGSLEETGETIDLCNRVFSEPLRRDILARVVNFHRNALRKGLSSAKNRAEVSGSGRKPHQQKGLGKARAGSIRAPQRRHGGQAHPPKPRDFSTDLQKKVRALGLRIALSARYRENRMSIIQNPIFDAPSTATAAKQLAVHNWGNKVLIVLGDDADENFVKSLANISSVTVCTTNNLNVYLILAHSHISISTRAVDILHYRFVVPNFVITEINEKPAIYSVNSTARVAICA